MAILGLPATRNRPPSKQKRFLPNSQTYELLLELHQLPTALHTHFQAQTPHQWVATAEQQLCLWCFDEILEDLRVM